MSRLSGACYEEIQEWLARRLSPHYLAVYIDATFCSTRRDGSVSKEAYYTMLGLLPDGSREVLTVVNHPTEGAIAWEMELEALKERGVEQIDLIVSDALSGIENAVCSAFPTALHQLCVVHFKRKVLNTVSTKDKAEVGEELKALFPVEHTDITPLAAYENLRTFARRWGKKYPCLARLDRERNAAYFTYLRFPESVRRIFTRPTGWNVSIAATSALYSCVERCHPPPPWFIFWALLPRRKRKGRMQDDCRIFGNGKSSKTTNKNQHHKFLSDLGYPKPEGKDEGESYTLFRTLPLD